MKVRSVFYIVENDGTFWRMPKKTFFRILQHGYDEAHAEFARQRVRYAQIDVAHDGKQAIRVARATFHSLKFDDAGLLDEKDMFEQQGLALQLLVDPDDMNHPGRREARIKKANEEFDLRFAWVPTDELRERLYAAALANKRSRGAAN